MCLLINKLMEIGEKIDTSNNSSISLDRDSFWIIVNGYVDIFLITEQNNKPKGSRFFFHRVEKGEAFFSLKKREINNTTEEFISVPSVESDIYEIKIENFYSLILESEYQDKLSDITDHWISNTSKSLLHSKNNISDVNVISASGITEQVSGRVTSLKTVFWCNLPVNSMLENRFPVYQNSTVTGFFPLSPALTVIIGDEQNIQALTTKDFAPNKNFSQFFDNFNFLVSGCIHKIKAEENVKEKKEFYLRKSANEKITESTLNLLTLPFTKKNSIEKAGANGDSINNIFNILGKHESIKFNFPKKKIGNEDIETRILSVLNYSNVRSRKVILSGTWYRGDSGSMIGFLKKDMSPVVLLQKDSRKYLIVDSEKGIKKEVNEKVDSELHPFAYSVYRPLPEENTGYKGLLSYALKGQLPDVIGVILIGIGVSLLGLLTPLATSYLFDTVIPEGNTSSLVQITVILFVCSFSISMLSIAKSFTLQRLSSKISYKAEASIWDRLLSLPVTFFNKYTSGDLAQRAMGIKTIHHLMNNIVITTILNSIFSIAYLALLFYYSVSLALIGLGIISILILFSMSLAFFSIKYQKKLIAIHGELSGLILQFITGISKLRTGGAEDRAYKVWAEKYSEKQLIEMKADKISNFGKVFNSVFSTIASVVIFLWVIEKLTQGALSPGSYMGFNSAYLTLQGTLLSLCGTFFTIQQIAPIYKRLKPILDEKPEITSDKPSPGELNGNIEVNEVSFRYGEDKPLILDKINVSVQKGSFVAIVGSSGSGKSTLIRLLLGFEKPQNGTVSFDDYDLESINIKDVRKQLGVVLQNSSLIQGSIFENIVGSMPLTMDDAWRAARMAGCDGDIAEMPMGMHTVLSADGGTISGGQKQRIMIARALIRDPKILVFDEATSALDNRTQAIISSTIEKLQVTRIVIAHRLSTIINADKIYVLQKGKIVQEGHYDELIKEEGPFAMLAKRQLS